MFSTSLVRTRLVVWALLAVVIAVALQITSAGVSSGPVPPAAAVAESFAAADVSATADVNTVVLAATQGKPPTSLADYTWTRDPDDHNSALRLLPAYRWAQNVTLVQNSDGVLGMGDASVFIWDMFASGGFMIAGFAWGLLLGAIAFAMTLNLSQIAGQTINNGFTGLFGALNNSGVVALAVVGGVLMTAIAIMKVRFGQAMRTIVGVVVPLGVTFGLAFAAAGPGGAAAAGSPAWIAERGTGYVDDIAVRLGGGFGLADRIVETGTPDDFEFDGDIVVDNTCAPYIATMYGQYEEASQSVMTTSGERSGPIEGLSGNAGSAAEAALKEAERVARSTGTGGASRSMLASVSRLWERSLLQPWVLAQYSTTTGHALACHQLDAQNGITPTEQRALLTQAGVTTPAADGVYRQRYNNGPQQAAILAWVACTPTATNDAVVSELFKEFDKIKVDDASCAAWANDGTTPEGLRDEDRENIETAIAAGSDTTNPQSAYEVRRLYDGMGGYNRPQRIIGGLAAAVAAVLYLFVLGPAALGSILAQLSLVILFMLLPFTLTVLAWPSKQRSPMAVKLLKSTGTAMGAKFALMAVMTLLMQTIATLESLLNSSGQGLGGLLSLLIPGAALFVVTAIMKKAGFGNLLHPVGAMGAASTGLMSLAAGENSAQRGARADRFASKVGDKSLKVGGKELSLNAGDRLIKSTAARAGKATAKLPFKATKQLDAATGGHGAVAAARANAAAPGAAGDTVAQRVKDGLAGAGDVAMGGAGGLLGGSPLGKKYPRLGKMGEQLAESAGGKVNARTAAQAARLHSRATEAEREDRIAKGLPTHDLDEQYAGEMLASGEQQLHDAAGAAGIGGHTKESWAALDADGRAAVLADPTNRADLATSMSKARRVSAGDVSVTAYGAHVRPPADGNLLPLTKNDDALKQMAADPRYYLPPMIRDRRPGESEDDHAARMHVALVRKGLVDATTGQPTGDYAAMVKVDLDTAAGMDEARKAMNGQPSKLSAASSQIQFSVTELMDIDRVMTVQRSAHTTQTSARIEVAASAVQVTSGTAATLTASSATTVAKMSTSAAQITETASTLDSTQAEAASAQQAVVQARGALDTFVQKGADPAVIQMREEMVKSAEARQVATRDAARAAQDQVNAQVQTLLSEIGATSNNHGKVTFGSGSIVADVTGAYTAAADVSGYATAITPGADSGAIAATLAAAQEQVTAQGAKVRSDMTRAAEQLQAAQASANGAAVTAALTQLQSLAQEQQSMITQAAQDAAAQFATVSANATNVAATEAARAADAARIAGSRPTASQTARKARAGATPFPTK